MRSDKINELTWQSGVSLIELLVVVAITAIVAGIGIPSYQSFVITNRIVSYSSNLHGSLILARTEAIKRGQRIVLCKSSNADAAAPTCDATASVNGTNTGWGSGWLTFADVNANNLFDAGDILVKVQTSTIQDASFGSVVPTNQDGSAGNEFLVFNATGQTAGALNFRINRPGSDTDATHDKAVCVLAGGRARSGNAPNC
jgi:prepilin-type N-terminal cleavage/methylation domain-containing protein